MKQSSKRKLIVQSENLFFSLEHKMLVESHDWFGDVKRIMRLRTLMDRAIARTNRRKQ